MSTQRIYYYDVINVISCMSVIALHVNGYVHKFDVGDQHWWLHVFFEVAFYNAVPLFFMLSGATLLGYRRKYDTPTFFKRRFKKAFLPFLFWTVVFFLFALLFTHLQPTPGFIVRCLLTCKFPFTDYWFFLPLFLLYLFMPFLSAMVTHLEDREILALAGLIIVLQAIVNPVGQIVEVEWNLPIGSYVAYLLLGYYLSRTSWEQHKGVVIAITLIAIFFMALRYVCVLHSTERISFLWTYLSLWAYFGSCAIFLIIKRLCMDRGGFSVSFPPGRLGSISFSALSSTAPSSWHVN